MDVSCSSQIDSSICMNSLPTLHVVSTFDEDSLDQLIGMLVLLWSHLNVCSVCYGTTYPAIDCLPTFWVTLTVCWCAIYIIYIHIFFLNEFLCAATRFYISNVWCWISYLLLRLANLENLYGHIIYLEELFWLVAFMPTPYSLAVELQQFVVLSVCMCCLGNCYNWFLKL